MARERMGWIAFIFSLSCLLQMAAIPLIARARNKKRFALTLALIEPVLFIIAVTLALVLPPGIRMAGFISAVFIAGAFVHLSRPVIDDWFASTIPTTIRGRYLGRRLQVISIAIITATMIMGVLGQSTGMANTLGLGLILITGALCGMLSILTLRSVPMPALAANSQPRLQDFANVFKTAPFLVIIMVNILYSIPFYLAVPYYQIFNLEVAAMPATMIAIMQSGYFIVKIVALPWLGRGVDRWGPQRSLFVAGFVYVTFFGAFLFCQPGFYWPVMIAWAVVALADGLFGLATQTALYASVPDSPSRPAYFAVSNIVSLVFYGIAGLAAVPLLEAIKGITIHVGPLTLGSFHLLYGVCALLMIPCLFSARLVSNARIDATSTPPSQNEAFTP